MADTVKIPARDWKFELNTTGSTWVEVKGTNEWGWKNSVSHADTTVKEDEGWESHMPILRGAEITLTGLFKEDPATGARDPGQEAIEALGEGIGLAGLKPFRITSPGGTVKEMPVSSVASPTGGADKDATKWEATLKVDGKPTTTPPTP